MAEKRGRKSAYELKVKPYLDKIAEWKKTGATDEQICTALGVGKTSYYAYLKKHPEMLNAQKKGKQEFCFELRGELAKLCFKHTLITTKQYIKTDEETGTSASYTEITKKEVDADIAAINLLLKNLDETWANDPRNLELRRQEFELKKRMAEANNFDIKTDDL